MIQAVAVTKTTKSKIKPERSKSKLVQHGEEAMRKLLLKTLKDLDWNLTHVAEELEMTNSSNVLRMIRQLDLIEEYDEVRIKRITQ